MNKKYYELVNETLYDFECKSGLKVYLLPKKGYYKTYGILATNFGSCNDNFMLNDREYNVISGAAHFLEHKMFEKENYDVMDKFASQQASSNAFTSFDKTAYLFSATDNIALNVETLLDFVYNIELSEQSVEKEKPIIASEIMMYQDDSQWQSFFQSLQALYHNNSVRKDIAGDIDSVYSITKEDLELYYNTFYHPSNMVLFIVGNFNVEEIKDVILKNQNKEYPKKNLNLIKEEEPKSVKSSFLTKKMDVLKTSLTYSFKINDYLMDPLKQDISMSLLLDLVFSKSSDFYLHLINNKIITNDYDFQYIQDINNDFKIVQFDFVVNDVEYLEQYLNEYFNKNLVELLNVNEFNSLKAKYLGDYFRIFNSCESIANNFISHYFSGYDFFEMYQVIEDVSIDDLNILIKLFDKNYSSITKIQPK